MATKPVTIDGDQTGVIAVDRHAETVLGNPVEIRLLKGAPGDSLQIIFKDREAFVPQHSSCSGNGVITVTPRKKGTWDYMVIANIGGKTFTDLNCPSIHVQ